MPFLEKAMMDVDRRIKIGIGYITTVWTPEQLSPTLFDALAAPVREPLAPLAASGAILTGAMWVHFHGDGPLHKRFFFRQPSDLSAQVVGLLAIQSPTPTPPFGRDFAQPLEEQHTAGILLTHASNSTSRLVGAIRMHAANMLPQVCRVALSPHRLA